MEGSFIVHVVNGYSSLFVFIIIFLTIFLRQRRINSFPPGPPPYPLVGNLLSYGKKPFKSLDKWAEMYGSMFTLYQGPFRRVIWINDAKLAIELFLKQPDIFSLRKRVPFIASNVDGSIIWENGPAWKTHRRWMMSALRHFGMGKRSLETRLNIEAEILCKETDKFKSDPFDPLHVINCAVANIICSMSFGDRYDYSDPVFVELLANLLQYFRQINIRNIEIHIPFIVNLPMFKHKKAPLEYMKTFIKKIIEEHKLTFDPDNIRDIIDMLFVEVEKSTEEEKSYFDQDSMGASIMTIFVAASETTTSTLMWFLLFMATYPDVQAKVQDELDSVLEGSKPTMADRIRLPYLEATTYEVQRLGNIAGSTLPHGNSQDCIIEGYNIPKGTDITLNLYRIHTDPKYWDEPMTFDPSRFLVEDGKKIHKPEVFMPFGIGRRACLGESLAKMEMFLFMANFLQRFQLVVPEGRPNPTLEPHHGFTRTPKPYEICAISR